MKLHLFLTLNSALTIYHGAAGKSTGTTTSSAVVHKVTAGYENGYQFIPNTTVANPGDTIVFYFETSGHSVVKADFGNPCIPFDTIHPGESSFFSGVFEDTSPPGTWNLTVNDTSPTFFYCSANGSCLVHHMIGVINPNTSYTLEQQAANITSNSIMLKPGDPLPGEGGSESSSGSSIPSASPNPSTALGTSTSSVSIPSSPSASSNQHKGLSLTLGAIVGIVLAGVAILALACALFWFIGRHRTMKQETSAVSSWVNSHGGPPSSFGPTSTQDDTSTMEVSKHWEGRPLYGYPSPCVPPQPQVQEMGVAEVSELSNDVQERGRSRKVLNRFSAPAKISANNNPEGNIYEKE